MYELKKTIMKITKKQQFALDNYFICPFVGQFYSGLVWTNEDTKLHNKLSHTKFNIEFKVGQNILIGGFNYQLKSKNRHGVLLSFNGECVCSQSYNSFYRDLQHD